VRRVRRQAGSFSRSVDGVQPTGGLHASVPAVTILLCLIIPLLSPTAAAGPLSPAPPYPVPSPVVVRRSGSPRGPRSPRRCPPRTVAEAPSERADRGQHPHRHRPVPVRAALFGDGADSDC